MIRLLPSQDLVAEVRDHLVRTGAEPRPEVIGEAVRDRGHLLGHADLARLVADVRSELAGAGPLDPLLADPAITDVLVNGDRSVFVDRGAGLERANVGFADEASVRRLAQRLAAAAGRRLDDAQPFVDARLPDGTRLHAVLPPLARPGTLISLRLPRRRAFTLAELVAAGACDAMGARWLGAVMAARLSFLVSGGTGTGKTTVLAALLGLVPAHERLVIVEDSAELAPDHPHAVSLEARLPNVEGSGAIPMRELVRQSLRMRPDRLVVGEVRGAEVVDLLAALNTGHQGGTGTVHCNSVEDLPARLTALAAPAGWTAGAVEAQAIAGLEAVVHLVRDRDGRRRLDAIGVLVADGRNLRVETAVRMQPDHVTAGPGLPLLRRRLGSHAPAVP